MPYTNLQSFAPEIWLCVLGILVLCADLVLPARRRAAVPVLAAVGLLVCLKPVLDLWGGAPSTEFHGSFAIDGLSLFIKAFAMFAGAIIIVLSVDFFRRSPAYGEFFSLVVFLVLGVSLLAGATDLVLIYLSFEFVSLTSYLLAAWNKKDPKSNEAGMKYFIYGAAASGVMLYGMTLVYAAGGSTNLFIAAESMMKPIPGAGLALPAALGLVLMLVGFGYKVSMAPFHAWAPDVYEGSPTPVAALFSVAPKAAGLAVLMRVLFTLSPGLELPWQMVLAVLACLTMFVGNLLAIRQTDIKRMLAYSSIAHAGYMLIAVVVGPDELWGMPGLLIYLAAYLFMNLGLFAVAIALERHTGDAAIESFAGLGKTAPALAILTFIFLLSLTGIPPTAGFLGKLYIFAAAIKSRQWAWLAVVGIVNSVISLYYYMNIARLMYFDKREGPAVQGAPAAVRLTLLITGVGTVVVFIFPNWLVEMAQMASLIH